MTVRLHLKLVIFFMLYSVFVCHAQNTTFTSRLIYPLLSANDDIEEREDGTIYFDSSDIELGYDGDKKQFSALRFQKVNIPAEAVIKKAYLLFTVDETSNDNSELLIEAEAGSSAPFSNSDFNLSSRIRSGIGLSWNPDAWTAINDSGIAQQSVDISALIADIRTHATWTNGDAMTFIISGSGSRVAYSFDKDPKKAAQLVIDFEFSAASSKVTNLLINELMPKNYLIGDDFNEADDWLELYNSGTEPVNATGLFLSDDILIPGKWQIKTSLIIPAGGFSLLWIDNDEEQGPLHANFKLSAAGETIVLSQFLDNRFEIIDIVSFDSIAANLSYGRVQDGAENSALMGKATPGTSNNKNTLFFPAPEFSHVSGYYPDSMMVEIASFSAAAKIYYTIDGSNPDTTTSLYQGPIKIDSTCLLKAIAVNDGYAPSKEAKAFYLLKDHNDLFVFNIATKTEYLWDDSVGIYTIGTNGAYHNNKPLKANFYQDWERPADVTLIGTDGLEAFTEGAGIAIGGNASRKQIQKTFNIHFRNEYGNGKVKYKLFDDRDVDKFKHFKLRNAGQDFRSTMIRDGLNHSILINDADIDALAYRPAVLYLNGQYWGMYGLRESFNDDYIDTYHPVKKDKLDILRGSGYNVQIKEGSDSAYHEMYDYIQNNDMALDSNLDTVAKRMEMDSFIDYLIAQIYYANYDWPANNKMCWKDQKNGKFRWMIFDTDASTNYEDWGLTTPDFNSLEFVTSETSSSWPNSKWSNVIMRQLFKNSRFRNEFSQRYRTHTKLLFSEDKVNHLIDSVLFMVDMEIDDHIQKWNQVYDFGSNITCDSTREAWELNVASYRQFFMDRPAYMTEHLKTYFDLNDSYNLLFNYDNSSNGSVYVNTSQIAIPYDFSNEYFKGIPLEISAMPDSGYYFVEWKESADTSSTIQFIGSKSSSLTPVFARLDTVSTSRKQVSANFLKAFPNPAYRQDVNLNLAQLKESESYQITVKNMLGQEVLRETVLAEGSFNKLRLKCSAWKGGTYLVSIKGSGLTQTIKLVIQN